jgi:hypothetical protein
MLHTVLDHNLQPVGGATCSKFSVSGISAARGLHLRISNKPVWATTTVLNLVTAVVLASTAVLFTPLVTLSQYLDVHVQLTWVTQAELYAWLHVQTTDSTQVDRCVSHTCATLCAAVYTAIIWHTTRVPVLVLNLV